MLRPEIGATAAAAQGGDFTVLAVGSERELGHHVKHLLEEARLAEARLLMVPTLQAALTQLAAERPGIIFLAVGPPELANLSALVRLQAAAPGVPVVPLPTLAHEPGRSRAGGRCGHGAPSTAPRWWACCSSWPCWTRARASCSTWPPTIG